MNERFLIRRHITIHVLPGMKGKLCFPKSSKYTVGQKVSLLIFAIGLTLSTASQFKKKIIFGTYILDEICNRGYTVSPPNMVCVTALPYICAENYENWLAVDKVIAEILSLIHI